MKSLLFTLLFVSLNCLGQASGFGTQSLFTVRSDSILQADEFFHTQMDGLFKQTLDKNNCQNSNMTGGGVTLLRCLEETNTSFGHRPGIDDFSEEEIEKLVKLERELQEFESLSKNGLSSLRGGSLNLGSYIQNSPCINSTKTSDSATQFALYHMNTANPKNGCLEVPGFTMADVCDCKKSNIEKGLEKEITPEVATDIFQKAKINKAKDSLRELIGLSHKNSYKVNSLLTGSGNEKYKKKFIDSPSSLICTPGNLLASLKMSKCNDSDKIFKLIDEEINKALIKCRRDVDSDECRYWSKITNKLPAGPYEESLPELILESIDIQSLFYLRGKGLQIEYTGKSFSKQDLEYISNFKYRQFIPDFKKYFKEGKNESERALNDVSQYENLFALGAKIDGEKSLDIEKAYSDAKIAYTGLTVDPFLKNNDVIKGLNFSEDNTVAEGLMDIDLAFRKHYKKSYDKGGHGAVIDQIYSEGVEELISDCQRVQELTWNLCEVDNPFKDVDAKELLGSKDNSLLSAIDSLLSTYSEGEEKENAKAAATQLYCMYAGAQLESASKGEVVDFDSLLRNNEISLNKMPSFKDTTNKVVRKYLGENHPEITKIYNKAVAKAHDFGPPFEKEQVENKVDDVKQVKEVPKESFTFPTMTQPFQAAKNEINYVESQLENLEEESISIPDSLKEEMRSLTSRFDNIANEDGESTNAQAESSLSSLYERLDNVNERIAKLKDKKLEQERLLSSSTQTQPIISEPVVASGEVQNLAPRSIANISQPVVRSSIAPTQESRFSQSPVSSDTSSARQNFTTTSSSADFVQAVVRNDGLVFSKSDIANSIIAQSEDKILQLLTSNDGEPVLIKVSEGLYTKYDLVENSKGEMEVIKTTVIVEDEFDVQQEEGIIEEVTKKRKIYRLKDFEREFNKNTQK